MMQKLLNFVTAAIVYTIFILALSSILMLTWKMFMRAVNL